MNQLKLNLENCYGIKKLKKNFNFSDEGNTFIIYAQNGVMKTSLAKTFEDLSLGRDSADLIFPKRKTIREIKKEDGSDLAKEEIFVIRPNNNEGFNSEKVPTLLVNEKLRKRYGEIHLKIDEEKDEFFKELKILSGLKNGIEEEISRTFMGEDDKLFNSLEKTEKKVMNTSNPLYSDISYKEIFNEKVLDFLKTEDFKEKVEQYIEKYNELIKESKYFKGGIFNHNNASAVARSLADNGFFEAEHSVSLKNSKVKEVRDEFFNKEELEKAINEEKDAILKDPDLAKIFEELDTKLKANKGLRDFREYLSNNPKILPELKNPDNFREKLWISYFKSQKDLYINLLEEYRSGKPELDKIIEEAKEESTRWESVLKIFKERFFVPFELVIKNQSDVILKENVPNITFVFKDLNGEVSEEKTDLLQVLSSGEKRALYILNILFEVKAREEDEQETLFIFDDIVDSFDYKNKYAIIEYLKDISEKTNFQQIILTHNFDFFRTIESRFLYRNNNCLIVQKNDEETKIIEADRNYIKNPFKLWMDNLDDDRKLIASIPFVRNLVEYTMRNTEADNLSNLMSLLHIKLDSDSVLKSDLQGIYKDIFPDINLVLEDGAKEVISLIFDLADSCPAATESMDLENKIILSIAIRLGAEKFVWSKVANQDLIDRNQTRELLNRFKDEFDSETSEQENIKILEQVSLMTPENIHLNSFMYEPILDMSIDHLKDLYEKVKELK